VQCQSGDSCAKSILAAFIADPATELNGSCIKEALPLPFALPADGGTMIFKYITF
jgi:hypothetical protein